MRRGLGVVVVAGALVFAGVAWGVRHDVGVPFLDPGPVCVAQVAGHRVELSPEQAENAALISAIAVERGMPARAASIALATAYQESDLYNLDYGDRDSLGLFQQRPSQGWGSEDQVQDPVYATNAFYDALARVDGYQALEITVAAQEVQRSAFPGAYADHELDARALASALTGNSPHAFWCDLDETDGTGSSDAAGQALASVFGDAEERVVGSRLVVAARAPASGWAMAHYLVAQAERLGVAQVHFRGRTWRAGDDGGWSRGEDVTPGVVRVEMV